MPGCRLSLQRGYAAFGLLQQIHPEDPGRGRELCMGENSAARHRSLAMEARALLKLTLSY
jgi:hypothetical protein